MEAMHVWERHSQTRGTIFIVGKQLALYAERHTDLAWPSNRELARSTRLSERQVQRALRQLERTGEIIRQPPAPGRRRVYRLTPSAPQPSLFDVPGRQVVTQKATGGHPPQGDKSVGKGDTHARAGSNGVNPLLQTPPGPPMGGEAPAPDLLDRLHTSDQTPRVTVRVEREAPARRRRRRRRDEDGACVASGPCPLRDELTESAESLLVLQERWAELAGVLRERVGGPMFDIWLANGHVHQTEPVLQLALAPSTIGWAADRFGQVIAAAAGCDVEIVACHGAPR